ncbi:hypothetical protein QF000_001327 [Paraburkholderia atlantica]
MKAPRQQRDATREMKHDHDHLAPPFMFFVVRIFQARSAPAAIASSSIHGASGICAGVTGSVRSRLFP